ncbi:MULTISPECIES: helix-turn-helix domain-containing protein [unclassified Aliiroseovarius]|uniref:helix-turn-helix domain-containing protein n=1 Tax=unclassified Aliiroseovarius TaxID=2623558 RepID=UPI001568CB5A|nr:MULTISPECIES: helix-turn-helix domain-containing protein [unclassified Aliiroseovarius]NRP13972.1 hypothetical protein [Aliiroseovarius sp. xm-d-517]NRP41859.1 hypothetical protein [Aliiroseovarius sp. xm-m-339-2]NRP62865.1 hypothetical protein [Aliiroseovarius sp. xm-a-151]
MSNNLLNAVYALDLACTYERHVLARLADRVNDRTGVCWPSVQKIADDVCCSVRKVQGVLKKLEERGLISVERNAGPRGCNLYRLTLPPAADAPPHVVRPSTADTQPPQVTTANPAQDAPEPNKNPKKTLPKKAANKTEMEIEAIKAGKDYLLRGVTAHKARKLVSEGRVTEAECRAVRLL